MIIWRFGIPDTFPIPYFWQILSEDEKRKAEAFTFQKDRLKYIFCKGILRCLLAKYTEFSPARIQFQYTSRGKPYLASDLTFNLSHTSDRMMVALSLRNEIGIDVEKMRPVSDYLTISEKYFSSFEYQYIGEQNKEQQLAAFFHCWVRKEALLKGIGIGISTGLSAIQEMSCLESQVTISQEKWNIHSLNETSAYFAAIAHTGKIERIEFEEGSWEKLLSF